MTDKISFVEESKKIASSIIKTALQRDPIQKQKTKLSLERNKIKQKNKPKSAAPMRNPQSKSLKKDVRYLIKRIFFDRSEVDFPKVNCRVESIRGKGIKFTEDKKKAKHE